MNHKRIPLLATFLVFFVTPLCTAIAEKRADTADKPHILELRVLYGGRTWRQELLVLEGEAFRVVTRRGRSRVLVEGDVERIAEGVAFVNLKVAGYGPFGLEASQRFPKPLELKVNEFGGGGGGSSHLGIDSMWIRCGVDATPIMIKQLSAEPHRSAAAAYYLGELGSEAKQAIPALKQAANNDNLQVREAAEAALDKIADSLRECVE
jgi:hypothetical protein